MTQRSYQPVVCSGVDFTQDRFEWDDVLWSRIIRDRLKSVVSRVLCPVGTGSRPRSTDGTHGNVVTRWPERHEITTHHDIGVMDNDNNFGVLLAKGRTRDEWVYYILFDIVLFRLLYWSTILLFQYVWIQMFYSNFIPPMSISSVLRHGRNFEDPFYSTRYLFSSYLEVSSQFRNFFTNSLYVEWIPFLRFLSRYMVHLCMCVYMYKYTWNSLMCDISKCNI